MRILSFLCALVVSCLYAESLPQYPDVAVHRDLPYVTNGHPRQKLDLFVPKPKDAQKMPLLVWIHGGAWKEGDKSDNPALPALAEGCAVAGINYRFSQQAVFPAQIEDCKAAIRWLRAHAAEYQIDPDRIGVWGISAGGHLAALLGTSGDVKGFDVGENLNISSRVQCVVDWCGPTDFEEFAKFKGEIPTDTPDSPITALLGGRVSERLELARQANPITYISKDDPPFLVMHGDQDHIVPLSQAEMFVAALKKAGVPARLSVAKGGGHVFSDTSDQVAEFLRENLRSRQ